jgi:hypothetical protein
MLGPPKPPRLDQPIAVSLEDFVPANHVYRHLETKLGGNCSKYSTIACS